MDLVTYCLSKAIAVGAVSGIDSMSVDGLTLNFECHDGTHLEMTFPEPDDGVSVSNVELDSENHLICTMSDGTTHDAGLVPSGTDGRGITRVNVNAEDHLIVTYDDGTTQDAGIITVSALDELGEMTDVDITEPENGQVLKYNATTGKWENGEGGSSGDSTLTADVTSNLAVGAIPSGTTLEEGTTFTEFVQKLLITEIAPTVTFSASSSGVKEVGTSVTPTLTLTISDKGTGTPTSIKFYSGSTLLDTQSYVDGTNTYTFTLTDAITTTTTVKGVLEYTKSDSSSASIEKTATYTFVMASYYGAVSTAPTDKAGIIALTKNVKNTKALTATFTLSNQRSCYCYPASFGNLTTIKDANNFEYLASYTKTSVTVDDVAYNVYTLTDAVTATGFKQVYA